MSSIISGISSVAFGRTSGSSTFTLCISSMNACVYSAATSAALRPSSLALPMILSSTSVTFHTYFTSKPRHMR